MKELFIEELAEYLAGSRVAHMSIRLQMGGNEESLQWKKLRELSPLFGYPTKEEAIKELAKFLS